MSSHNDTILVNKKPRARTGANFEEVGSKVSGIDEELATGSE
jgi:hypothetical protein